MATEEGSNVIQNPAAGSDDVEMGITSTNDSDSETKSTSGFLARILSSLNRATPGIDIPAKFDDEAAKREAGDDGVNEDDVLDLKARNENAYLNRSPEGSMLKTIAGGVVLVTVLSALYQAIA